MTKQNSNPYDQVETNDLLYRYHSIVVKYVDVTKELSDKLDKFGKYRNELQSITVELVRRNIKLEDPIELVKIIEDALIERGGNG
jgi:hypothetical protein